MRDFVPNLIIYIFKSIYNYIINQRISKKFVLRLKKNLPLIEPPSCENKPVTTAQKNQDSLVFKETDPICVVDSSHEKPRENEVVLASHDPIVSINLVIPIEPVMPIDRVVLIDSVRSENLVKTLPNPSTSGNSVGLTNDTLLVSHEAQPSSFSASNLLPSDVINQQLSPPPTEILTLSETYLLTPPDSQLIPQKTSDVVSFPVDSPSCDPPLETSKSPCLEQQQHVDLQSNSPIETLSPSIETIMNNTHSNRKVSEKWESPHHIVLLKRWLGVLQNPPFLKKKQDVK